MAQRENKQGDVYGGEPNAPVPGPPIGGGPPPLPELPGAPALPPAPFTFGEIIRPDWNLIHAYEQRTPLEQQNLQAISDVARLIGGYGQGLYNVGMPAYTQALNYVQSILGPSKAGAARAIGPQSGAIADVYAGANRSLEAGPLRGGALDTARANLTQGRAAEIGNLIPQAQQNALGVAATGGLAGVQAGIGAEATSGQLNQAVVQNEAQNRQFAIGQEMANRFGAAGLATTLRGQDIGFATSVFGTETQGAIGLGSLQQSQYFNQANLDLAREQQAYQQQYQDQLLQLQQLQAQYAAQQAQGQKTGSIFSTLITTGGFAAVLI